TFGPHALTGKPLPQNIVIVILVILAVVSSAFSLFGIVAVIREDFKMSSIFAGMLVLNTILTLLNAIKRPYYWPAPTWSVLTLLVLLIMLRDLHTVERNAKNQFRNHEQTVAKDLYYS